MTRWLRLYDDTINDPKILKLPEATRWHWVALLCIASKNDGALPALDDIAIQLRVTPAKATEILSALVKAGLIDKLETGFAPHNWNGRQYKSDVSTDRVKRFRNGKRNVSETEEKRPQIQIQNTEAESKKEPRARALDWPEDFREQFWALYPNKVGKPKALSKLEGAMTRGVRWLDLMDGLRRYIQTKPPDRAWLNPETFLNQERWTDQPANVSANNGKTGNIIAASDSLLDVIDRFERGSSDVDQIRSGEGAPPVRLLS
ncbi:hypothetical protein [Tardiphaga sp. 841_E9_N1_2]|uniref:hypothetical protein n=1 Tax=Tardiphaga sp. 841_E9_N1_2 TaxID=3240762 RepID=UPI003F22521C